MFADFFKAPQEDFSFTVTKNKKDGIQKTQLELLEAESDVTKKIRKEGIKIKIIIPTKFGLEVVFYNKEDAKKAAELVGTNKIDGMSIFVD